MGRRPDWSLYGLVGLLFVWQFVVLRTWDQVALLPGWSRYIVEGLLCLASAVAFLRRKRPLGNVRTRPALTVGSALLAGLLPPLALWAGGLPGVSLALCVACTVWLVLMYACCGFVYARLGFERAAPCVLVSLMVGCALRLALSALPGWASSAVGVLVPVAFAVLCRRAAATVAEAPATPTVAVPPNRRLVGALAFELAVFSLAGGLFGTGDGFGYSWWHALVTVAAYGALLAVIAVRGRRLLLSQLFELALLVYLLAIIGALAVGDGASAAPAFVVIPHAVVFALFWLLLVEVETRGRFAALSVFMAGWAVRFTAIGVGQALSLWVGDGLFSPLGFTVLALLLVTSVVVVFNTFAAEDALFDAPARSGTAAVTVAELVDRQVEDLAAAYDLTPRELQVVRLVALGYSRGAIAERLSISENTVKGHVRNAYAHLGIHSKQELLGMLDERAADRSVG